MKSQIFHLIGNYTALIHRIGEIKGGTAALKQKRSAAAAALKNKQAALTAAYKKLRDAQFAYESLAGSAIATVNKALAPLAHDCGGSADVIQLAQHAEYAMTGGARYLDQLAEDFSLHGPHAHHGDLQSTYNPPVSS